MFLKKKKSAKKILSKDEILSSIPNNSLKSEDKNLQMIKTECRWRIMKFDNIENEIIEISIKKPNEKRLFVNQNNEWIEHEENNNYDKFVIESFFYYI